MHAASRDVGTRTSALHIVACLEGELEARPGCLAELFLGRVVQVVMLDAVQGGRGKSVSGC